MSFLDSMKDFVKDCGKSIDPAKVLDDVSQRAKDAVKNIGQSSKEELKEALGVNDKNKEEKDNEGGER